jgi:hypothetical protein
MTNTFDVSQVRQRTFTPNNVGVRLSAVPLAVIEMQDQDAGAARRVDTIDIGPRFVGQVAMASHEGELVVVGHVADGELQVWRGAATELRQWTDFTAHIPAGGLVALVHHAGLWHLFARSEHGRSTHLVSPDLVEWTSLYQLAASFPAFAVSGAAIRNGDLLLVGRVFVDNTAFGWGLLRSDGLTFEARPVPLPLATQLGVLGPVVNCHGAAVLLLDSGKNRTVAKATGAGWTLSLLVPKLTPVAAFAAGVEMWLVGQGTDGTMSVARVNEPQVSVLSGVPPGRIRSALAHDQQLVMACEC